MRQQLKDRLSPHCPGLRPEELEDIISECTHVFGGMQTHAQERGTSSYEYLDEFLWVRVPMSTWYTYSLNVGKP